MEFWDSNYEWWTSKKCSFNPFDLTKVWPHGDYPMIKVGTMTLNENPKNYFQQDTTTRPTHNHPPGREQKNRTHKNQHHHQLEVIKTILEQYKI